MPQDRSNPAGQPDQALLCWSDAPNSPLREEFVQILRSHLPEAVIRCSLEVSEKTKVTLIGKDYTGIGIVKSCRRDGENFILSIGLTEEFIRAALPSDADPGALVVDDFVTEEQETKILEGLQDSLSGWMRLPTLLWSHLLFAFTKC
jgi:hypothetical protein